MQYCAKCGSELSGNEAFCGSCGAPVVRHKAEIKKSKRGISYIMGLISGLLVFALIFTALSGIGLVTFGKDAASDEMQYSGDEEDEEEEIDNEDDVIEPAQWKFEGNGFSSPEEAVVAYLETMRHGDVSAMIRTFAVETYVENYDLAAQIENAGGYNISMEQTLNNSNDYAQQLNISHRYADLTKNLDEQYLFLLGYEEELLDRLFAVANTEPYDFAELLGDAAWMDKLSNLEIGKVYVDDDVSAFCEKYTDDQVQSVLESKAKICGADEYVSVMAEFELDNEDYFLCMDVICYDGMWYNCNHSGVVGTWLGINIYCAGMVRQDDL